jgi:hypothetical protein
VPPDTLMFGGGQGLACPKHKIGRAAPASPADEVTRKSLRFIYGTPMAPRR